MPRVHRLLGAAVLLLGVVSCEDAQRGSGLATQRTQDPNVRTLPAADPEVRAAIARARASTGELLWRLERPPRSQTFLSVKVRLADGQGAEHLWLDSLRYDGRRLTGRLNDEPMIVQDAQRGDVVQVAPGDITDWMAVDGGRLCGGFTVRLQRRRMSAGERATLERDLRLVRVPTDTSTCATAH